MSSAIEQADVRDKILASIDGEAAPLGVPPSLDDPDGVAIQFRDAYRAALRAEGRGGENGEAGATEAIPHWQKAAQLSIELLSEHHKDLQTVAILTLAVARTEGAAGVAFGYQIATHFASDWWDAFLASWKDDVAAGVRPLDDLNQSLVRPLKRLPITEDGKALWKYHRAVELEGVEDSEERQRRIARGDVEKAVFMQSVEASPPEFYRKLVGDLEACQQAIKAFDELYYEKLQGAGFAHAAPGTASVREQIDDTLMLIQEIAADKLVVEEPEEPGDEEQGEGGSPSGRSGGASGTPRNRAEALELLETAAKFFDRAEPQSLLPSMIRWVRDQGGLSPREFYEKLIRNNETRQQLSRMVGIDSDASEEESYD